MAENEREVWSEHSSGLILRAANECRWDLVSLGEVMLRFDPGEQRIVGARSFRVWEGGGEYNVARGLRRCFGMRTTIATSLVDNSVGRLVEDLILQGGVDTSHIRWMDFDGVGTEARNGIYFLERGFGVRAGLGVMDRGHTAIAQIRPGEMDWHTIFAVEGARWFHTGGIMAALSDEAVEVVREAMLMARQSGAVVSFDCNYRPSLWKARGGRPRAIAVNRLLVPLTDVLFGHEGDVAAEEHLHEENPIRHTLATFQAMAQRVAAEFPNLRVLATTVRQATSASRNGWGAFGYREGEAVEAMQFEDLEILDRVGGGDSFASGLIYGLLSGRGLSWSLNCAVAHGALAMTTPGDASMATLAEVERLMAGGSSHTLR